MGLVSSLANITILQGGVLLDSNTGPPHLENYARVVAL